MDQPKSEFRYEARHDRTAAPPLGDAAQALRTAKEGPGLRLVNRRIVLAAPCDTGADEYSGPLRKLAAWLGIEIAWHEQGRASALRDAARRAMSGTVAPGLPRFEPWQWFSPIAFQDPRALRSLPRARWVAGYIHEIGTGPLAGSHGIDTLVMSPHPDACRPDEECAAALPGVAVVKAMIAAARAESRSRVAIIVPARCRGAATRLLLAAEPAPARAGLDFAVLSIEDALARIATGEPVWDAIIVLPELRGLIVTMLARQCKIAGPWPMLWHDRDRVLICGETPAGAGSGNALDATLLAQSLILAVQMAGHSAAARQLHAAWARLRDRGVTTARRGSDAPYVTQVSDADMVDLLCSDAPVVSDRAIAGWKALPPVPEDRPPPCAPRLSLVAGG